MQNVYISMAAILTRTSSVRLTIHGCFEAKSAGGIHSTNFI